MAKAKQRSSSKSPGSKSSGSAGSAAQRRNEVKEQRQVRVSASQNKQRQASPNRGYGKSKSGGGTWGLIVGAVLVIAAVIGVFIYLSQSSNNTPAVKPTPVSSSLLNEVTNVSPSILAAVGTGGQQKQLAPIKGGPPLTGSTGKPEVFYAGAEYCPFCAAQRWAMVVALSKFGTFSKLSQTASSSTDVYPSTSTFTFYQSVYTSQYIDFVSLETQTNQPDGNGSYTVLQTPTADQQNLVNKYDAPPYLQSAGSIPFIDIAGKYVMQGANYTPQVLAGLSWQNIADTLSNQNSDVTKGIVGSANYLIAAICNATSQQPAVCNPKSKYLSPIESSLGATVPNALSNQLGQVTPFREAVIRRLD